MLCFGCLPCLQEGCDAVYVRPFHHLLAMASNLLTSDSLQPKSNGLQALVPSSVALVTNSFLLLLVRHLFLVAYLPPFNLSHKHDDFKTAEIHHRSSQGHCCGTRTPASGSLQGAVAFLSLAFVITVRSFTSPGPEWPGQQNYSLHLKGTPPVISYFRQLKTTQPPYLHYSDLHPIPTPTDSNILYLLLARPKSLSRIWTLNLYLRVSPSNPALGCSRTGPEPRRALWNPEKSTPFYSSVSVH